jgi:hypothetical protein
MSTGTRTSSKRRDVDWSAYNQWNTVEIEIEGDTHLIQCNGSMADPMNPYAIRKKEFTSARKKTEAGQLAIEALDWEGGLYFDDGEDPTIIVPGDVLLGAYAESGARSKLKQDVRMGLRCPQDAPLLYDGKPKTLSEIKGDDRFKHRCVVKTKKGDRIVRVRPVFRKWSLRYELWYLPVIFNLNVIEQLTLNLGSLVGLSDDRKRGGGRFHITSWNGEERNGHI